jgi:hypothetical protein
MQFIFFKDDDSVSYNLNNLIYYRILPDGTCKLKFSSNGTVILTPNETKNFIEFINKLSITN